MRRFLRGERSLAGTRLGARGMILLLFGLFFLAYGLTLLSADPSPLTAWREELMPPIAWSVLWWTFGLIAVLFAFTKRDEIGYALALIVMIGWTLFSMWAWIVGDVERGWVSGLVFTLPTAILAVDAGRPEHPRRLPEPEGK